MHAMQASIAKDKEAFKQIIADCMNDIAQKKFICAQDRQLAARFYSKNPAQKRYVIGRNAMADYLIAHHQMDGLIDDFVPEGTKYAEISTIYAANVPKDAVVVNCSSVRMIDILHKLEHEHGLNVINFNRLSYLTEAEAMFTLLPTAKETIKNYNKNKEAWADFYASLYDEKSKEVLLDVLRFRMSFEARFMQHYTYSPDKQYFEDFMRSSQDVFVDAGAFDGETSKIFAKFCPDYEKIYVFEPSAFNMKHVKENLASLRDVVYFDCGLSDQKDKLRFAAALGSSSVISAEGTEEIDVDTLDNLTAGKVSFIKMDLEGWELAALQGASNIITQQRPKLAIGAYHQTADLLAVYRFVMSLQPDYRVLLRHYTQGWPETVLYFI